MHSLEEQKNSAIILAACLVLAAFFMLGAICGLKSQPLQINRPTVLAPKAYHL